MRSYELFARYVMPQFQGSLTSLVASNDWARDNRKTIFAPSVEAVKRAFTDVGRDAPADLADRALGGRDVQVLGRMDALPTAVPHRLDLAIRIEGVSHAFPTPDGKPMLALDDVSFDVPRGQFLALVGASGCGKTTILNMAAGLLQPVAGAVDGERRAHPAALAAHRLHVRPRRAAALALGTQQHRGRAGAARRGRRTSAPPSAAACST